MKGYGEYKNVGLSWLNEAPMHWEIRRGKQLFAAINERSLSGTEELLSVSAGHGVVKRKNANVTMFQASSYAGYKLCWPDDLVINSLWAWQQGLGFSKYHGIISTAYSVFRLRNPGTSNPRYYNYFMRGIDYLWELHVRSKGIWKSRYQLSDDDFLRSPMVCPPREEQDQIVRYLDTKVGKINKLIRIKQKQIALLKEKKQAIIDQAVTRGLDPNAPMKDSGIAWIGQIPEGWEIFKIKQAVKILRGKFNHRPRNDERLYGGKFPFIQTGDVAQSSKYIESYKQTLNSLGFAVSKEFPMGTLVMTIAANIGDVSILKFDACFPDSIVGFIPRRASIEYLYFLFLAMKPELLKEAPVNTQGNLNVERIGQMLIPLPEESIQEAVVQKLNFLDSLYQKKITIIGEEIATLTEYRTRLISDVVTGKVDVRGISIQKKVAEELLEDIIEENVVELVD